MLQYNEYVCQDEVFDLGAAERYIEEFICKTKKEAHEWIQSLIESIHAPVSVNGIGSDHVTINYYNFASDYSGEIIHDIHITPT